MTFEKLFILSCLINVAVICLIIYSGYRGVWIFGWLYREETTISDMWMKLALSGTETATEAVLRLREAIARESERIQSEQRKQTKPPDSIG